MAVCKDLMPCRYILAYMGFFCTMVVCKYKRKLWLISCLLPCRFGTDFCRINLSIAIVKMAGKNSGSNVSSDICIQDNSNNNDVDNDGANDQPDYQWSQAERGDLLGCYYYGYVCTQILGAWLSTKFGFKYLLLGATFVTSLITIFTPFLADAGYGWIFAARIVMGFFHGVTFPLLQGCWSVWGPPLERSKLIAIYVAGNSVGTTLIFPLGGFIAGSSLGWRSIFYFTGGSGIIWCILWFFLAYDSPAKHPRISKSERDYIERSILEQQANVSSVQNGPIPWKGLFTSKVGWSVACAHLASNWAVYQMNTLLPTYLSDVLQ